MPKRSLEDVGTKEVQLPDIVVTPRGNYVEYTGNETYTPSYADFLNANLDKSRISAVNKMLKATSPSIPNIPSRNPLSILLGKAGMSDEKRIAWFGKDEDGSTCIYTATTKYGDKDTEVPGNVTFARNPRKYGFKQIHNDSVKAGDLVQFSLIRPDHTVMVTGFNKDGTPVVSYSSGERVDTTYIDEPDGKRIPVPTMKKDVELDENFIDALGSRKSYRYIGTDSKRRSIKQQYSKLYKTRRGLKDGGSIHIAPSKRGTFTAAATKHGMGVQEFASRVLRNKEDFSTAIVKKANFARNASKWKH